MKKATFILMVIFMCYGIAGAYDFDIWTFFNHNANVTGPGSFDSMAAIGIEKDIIQDETRVRYPYHYTYMQYINMEKGQIRAAYDAGVEPMPEFFSRMTQAQQITFQIDSVNDARYRGHQWWNYFKCRAVGKDTTDIDAPSGYTRFVDEDLHSAGVVFDTLCLRRPGEGWNFDSYYNKYFGCRAIYWKYNITNGWSEWFTAYLSIKTDSTTKANYGTDDTLCLFKAWVADSISGGVAYYREKAARIITADTLIANEYVAVPLRFQLNRSDTLKGSGHARTIVLNFSLYWYDKGRLWFDEIDLHSERYDSLINGNYDDEIDCILDSLGSYVSYWILRDEPYPSVFNTSYKLDSIFVAKGSARAIQNYESSRLDEAFTSMYFKEYEIGGDIYKFPHTFVMDRYIPRSTSCVGTDSCADERHSIQEEFDFLLSGLTMGRELASKYSQRKRYIWGCRTVGNMPNGIHNEWGPHRAATNWELNAMVGLALAANVNGFFWYWWGCPNCDFHQTSDSCNIDEGDICGYNNGEISMTLKDSATATETYKLRACITDSGYSNGILGTVVDSFYSYDKVAEINRKIDKFVFYRNFFHLNWDTTFYLTQDSTAPDNAGKLSRTSFCGPEIIPHFEDFYL